MTPWLAVSVRPLTDSYHGNEWPPSPARLFQALLAGAMLRERGEPSSVTESALRWLEALPPPVILAPEASPGTGYAVFGPLNNWDVLAKQWAEGRESRRTPEQLRTQINFRPYRLDRSDGGGAVFLHYVWDLAGIDAKGREHAARICALAPDLLALGWGIDLATASAEVQSKPHGPESGERSVRYTPDSTGRGDLRLSVPSLGWTTRLAANYIAWSRRARGPTGGHRLTNIAGTVPSGRRQAYLRDPDRAGRAFASYRLTQLDGEPLSKPWEDSMVVAGWLRHAVGIRMEREGRSAEWIRGYVMGHGEGQARSRRLAYLPLPSIGHPHSDGQVRRALVADPPKADEPVARSLLSSLEGQRITDEKGVSCGRLVALGEADPILQRYVRPAQSWATVTPVILHGHDHRGRKFLPARAERLIEEAFEQAGLERANVKDFSYQRAPLWAGTGSALGCRVPAHLAVWPRFHVVVRFRRPVTGPVVVGLGRHYGIGLFAALSGPTIR